MVVLTFLENMKAFIILLYFVIDKQGHSLTLGRWFPPPPIFGSHSSRSKVKAPKYERQKGPEMMLEAWGPPISHDYTLEIDISEKS